MPLSRSIGQKSTFSEHGHVAYQIKWNHEMQQHGSNYFARRPPPPPPMPLTRSIGQKSTYHIEENHECSNMVTNIYRDTNSTNLPCLPSVWSGDTSDSRNFSSKCFCMKLRNPACRLSQGFFSGVSGAVIRPLSQWQMPTFFPNLNKKKSQSEGHFYVNQYS